MTYDNKNSSFSVMDSETAIRMTAFSYTDLQ